MVIAALLYFTIADATGDFVAIVDAELQELHSSQE
jgi:hypothetical protein